LLTEDGRGDLTNDIFSNVDFTYDGWEPSVLKYRFGSLFPQKLPSIGIQFLPTRERKFVSNNDIIEVHPENPEFFIYGYCELEAVRFFIACQDNVQYSGNILNGRKIIDRWARSILWRIRREWPTILGSYGASIEVGLPFDIRDLSRFFQATKRLVYEASLYLRTPHIWDFVPEEGTEGWETGVYAEDAVIYMDDDADKGGDKELSQFAIIREVDT